MRKLSPSRLILVTFGGVAVLYALFAFVLLRAPVEGVADHLKILSFTALVVGGIGLEAAFCPRFERSTVGVRLAITFLALVVATLLMGSLKQWLRHDAVWRELWDLPAVIFILPVAQSLFSRANVEAKKI